MLSIQKSRDHGLILSAKKAEIAKNQIEFLGLKIDQKGIEMQPHICEKILIFQTTAQIVSRLKGF